MRVGTTWWVGPNMGLGSYPYTERDVRALRSQVESAGHDLTVLSNQPGHSPLCDDRFWGWWSKLLWFAPWNRDLRPCLVIDLDTFVFELDAILSLDPSRLWLIRQFRRSNPLGESGLFIAPRDCDHIWEAVLSLNFADFPKGDGVFLRQFPHSFISDEVDGIMGYKFHGLQSRRPKNARVICFYSRPRPHEATGWAGEWFRQHAAERE